MHQELNLKALFSIHIYFLRNHIQSFGFKYYLYARESQLKSWVQASVLNSRSLWLTVYKTSSLICVIDISKSACLKLNSTFFSQILFSHLRKKKKKKAINQPTTNKPTSLSGCSHQKNIELSLSFVSLLNPSANLAVFISNIYLECDLSHCLLHYHLNLTSIIPCLE